MGRSVHKSPLSDRAQLCNNVVAAESLIWCHCLIALSHLLVFRALEERFDELATINFWCDSSLEENTLYVTLCLDLQLLALFQLHPHPCFRSHGGSLMCSCHLLLALSFVASHGSELLDIDSRRDDMIMHVDLRILALTQSVIAMHLSMSDGAQRPLRGLRSVPAADHLVHLRCREHLDGCTQLRNCAEQMMQFERVGQGHAERAQGGDRGVTGA